MIRKPFLLRLGFLCGFGLVAILLIPVPLDKKPYSKVLYDVEGQLLSAKVAADEQWRFPSDRSLPNMLVKSIVLYEDEWFYWHPGFNPVSLLKSFFINVKSGRIVRGGSTLSMQVARMARDKKRRTYREKVLETLGALKLEILYSKDQIIQQWCTLASFGGNVVGIEAASWRYFGRPLDQLSVAEYATLAVLPNAPALIHPSRNRQALKEKRNRLLEKLDEKKQISGGDLVLYQSEPIPFEPKEMPQQALHLLEYLCGAFPQYQAYQTTIQADIQHRIHDFTNYRTQILEQNGIRNAAILVLDVEEGNLLAYVGNTRDKNGSMRYVDLIQAPRSYGSLLKPFLFAQALDKGMFLPEELISDIPTYIDGFEPKNFDKQFRGVVSFRDVLIQSLNVPSVRVLYYLGHQVFYDLLQSFEPDFLNKGANHYGLSIILGGGESNLWSLSRMYLGLARKYLKYRNDFIRIRVLKDEDLEKYSVSLGNFACHQTVEALADVVRPREETGWKKLHANNEIAWKTGTSYGHRDAWTIGFNSKYLVGIWVGNENGEGREKLTGITTAAPIFFDVMDILGERKPFLKTFKSSHTIKTCAESGKLAGKNCSQLKNLKVDQYSHQWSICDLHEIGSITDNGYFKPIQCLEPNAKKDTFFTLDPIQAYYTHKANPFFYVLPPIDPTCEESNQASLRFIYPFKNAKVFLPIESNGERRSLIAKASTSESKELFWFLNEEYLGTTINEHDWALDPIPGQHELSISDAQGNRQSIFFQVRWN